MLSRPPPRKIAGLIAAWITSNLVWTLLSGFAGATTSAVLKEAGVFENAFGLVAVALLVAAISIVMVQKVRQRQQIRAALDKDDRLAVAIYGETKKELERRAQQHARENVNRLEGR
jgi:hypothetical protein